MKLSHLIDALNKSKNAALVVGAGISYDMNIPLGYRIPILYGEAHPDILKKHNLYVLWQQAVDANDVDKWRIEEEFVQVLVAAFMHSNELQQTFVDWLSDAENTNIGSMSGTTSDIHAALVIAWLKGMFRHLITTNWDFLLEYQVDSFYHPPKNLEGIYPDPFDPVTHLFTDGRSVSIEPHHLYFLNPKYEDDFFWEARWNIVAKRTDLKNLERWTRPIWKIHGSPFFLTCPQCGGFSRWKRQEKLTVGDPCPQHSDETLKPEIIFWGQGIDTVDALVWKRLKARLQRSDLIVVSGFSGSGSDVYIRSVIENHPNAWVVNPNEKYWDTSKVKYISAYASDFTDALIEEL